MYISVYVCRYVTYYACFYVSYKPMCVSSSMLSRNFLYSCFPVLTKTNKKPKLKFLSSDEFNFKLTMTISKITTLKCPLNRFKQLKNTR